MKVKTKSEVREKQEWMKQENKLSRVIDSEKRKNEWIKQLSTQLKKSWSEIIIIKCDSSENETNKAEREMRSFLKFTKVNESTWWQILETYKVNNRLINLLNNNWHKHFFSQNVLYLNLEQ